MDEDPGAPNYDPKLKLIKSLMNGSRGPMLRKATALDWTGDPIDVKNRFPSLGHGEDDYKMMLAHFKGYDGCGGRSSAEPGRHHPAHQRLHADA